MVHIVEVLLNHSLVSSVASDLKSHHFHHLLVFLHLGFEVGDFLSDDLLVLLSLGVLNSLLILLDSLLNVRDLVGVGFDPGDLLVDDLRDGSLFFLVLGLLLFVFFLSLLKDVGHVLVVVLLVDHIGGLDTLRNVVQSFISGGIGIVLRRFNSVVDLGDLVGLLSDLALGLHLLLSFFLDDFLDGSDLTGN